MTVFHVLARVFGLLPDYAVDFENLFENQFENHVSLENQFEDNHFHPKIVQGYSFVIVRCGTTSSQCQAPVPSAST